MHRINIPYSADVQPDGHSTANRAAFMLKKCLPLSLWKGGDTDLTLVLLVFPGVSVEDLAS